MTSTSTNARTEEAGVSRPLPGDRAAMAEWAGRLVEQARADGVNLTGDGGLLTELFRPGFGDCDVPWVWWGRVS